MRRHRFRWDNFAFGLLFLAIVGNWIAWKEDAWTLSEFSVVAPVALIALGVLGVLASLRKPATPTPLEPITEPTTQPIDISSNGEGPS
ncbi:hypothetical protein BH09ACT10_BH09ACT10_24600 [soil metagenome]